MEIVEEHDERPLRPSHRHEQRRHRRVEAVLLLDGVDRRDRRLRPDDVLHLGDEVDDEAAVRREGVPQPRAHRREAVVRRRQRLRHELADGGRDRGVRGVPLELVELAFDERAAQLEDGPSDLVDQSRLADARRAGHQHAARCSGTGRLERGHEGLQFRLAAADALDGAQAPVAVAMAQREGVDPGGLAPPLPARHQVGEHTAGALVAVLGVLGHEPHHQQGQQDRQAGRHLVRRGRVPRHVAVDPLRPVVGLERAPSREQLVERGAQRVEIGAVVEVAVHAAAAFGRHVGQRAVREAVGREAVVLAADLRSRAEVDELHRTACRVPQDVRGVDVPVDDELVHAGQGRRHRYRRREETIEITGGVRRRSEGYTREPLLDEGEAVAPGLETQDVDDARALHPPRNAELQPEAGEVLRARIRVGERLDDHRTRVALPGSRVHRGSR